MIIWIDAQISPAIAAWIKEKFNVESVAVGQLGLRDSTDEDIFEAARVASAVVMTKDSDFVRILERRGQPPSIIWITCGNTSNENLKRILNTTLHKALKLLSDGDILVEIGDE